MMQVSRLGAKFFRFCAEAGTAVPTAVGAAAMQAALDSLAGDTSPVAAAVREQYAAARAVAEKPNGPQAATEYDELRLRAIKHQRKALERLRTQGTIGDEAYHRLEEELDWAELDVCPSWQLPAAHDLIRGVYV